MTDPDLIGLFAKPPGPLAGEVAGPDCRPGRRGSLGRRRLLALKAAYRDLLLAGSEDARIVYLEASYDLIDERLRSRRGHFFDPGLLHRQAA